MSKTSTPVRYLPFRHTLKSDSVKQKPLQVEFTLEMYEWVIILTLLELDSPELNRKTISATIMQPAADKWEYFREHTSEWFVRKCNVDPITAFLWSVELIDEVAEVSAERGYAEESSSYVLTAVPPTQIYYTISPQDSDDTKIKLSLSVPASNSFAIATVDTSPSPKDGLFFKDYFMDFGLSDKDTSAASASFLKVIRAEAKELRG